MKKIVLKNETIKAVFLENGDLYELSSGEIMINQLSGNSFDGSLNQIYLRIYTDNHYKVIPLIGSNSDSSFVSDNNQLFWIGNYEGVKYQVSFSLRDNLWFWTVDIEGDKQTIDLIYGQDIGLALRNTVKSNEAYTSQYIDNKILTDDGNYIIISRQNQPQSDKFPAIEQGSLNDLDSFSTDGYQFFGKQYKIDNEPKALQQRQLDNEVYQYEFTYSGLKTKKIILNRKSSCVFYGGFVENLSSPTDTPLIGKTIVKHKYIKPTFTVENKQGYNNTKSIGNTIVGANLTKSDLDKMFPHRLEEEYHENKLISFFTDNYHHVVLREKEANMERPTGHIILSGRSLSVMNPVMATTMYMYGVFNSQFVLGNTSKNKLMSNTRNSLNIMKSSGQRIYIKFSNKWHLLTIPSAFEMGLNSGKWYYKLEEDLITIKTYSILDGKQINTEIISQNGLNYEIAITNHIIMNDEEYEEYTYSVNNNELLIKPTKKSSIFEQYPNMYYKIAMDKDYSIENESLFGIDDTRLLILKFKDINHLKMRITGDLFDEGIEMVTTSYEREYKKYVDYIDSLINNFKLTHPNKSMEKINQISRWYTHNMLVHYLSPHGLEQYGGAAWGLRDVSQGPVEYFFAVNKPEVVKEIIQIIFSNQFDDDGNWPQWFMFDRYETLKANESHGDVIVWPLKVVADYLTYTGDFEILYEPIPYTDRKTYHKTSESYSLMHHLNKEMTYIKNNFLNGTFLSCYGDGDWDDTLQPNDKSMKKNMASSWTVALTYQAIKKLANCLEERETEFSNKLTNLARHISDDFQKYMLTTKVIPGFVYKENEKFEFIIHPNDNKTKIKYRFLPLNRSIISELVDLKQANINYEIIKNHLYFPDGVRLMNRPALYSGGKSKYFKRAEQSANFGREIGLQYVHAHIRFIEAMAKLGKKNETWQSLLVVNPINIQKVVPNAMLRQSNVYFSSSDGNFKTRYEAQENFDKLRTGDVGVKGGWRIYSSGPGIYLNQLISNVLGIREEKDFIIFDPILPDELDGLQMNYQINKRNVIIQFHLGTNEQKLIIDGKDVSFSYEVNRYRSGGYKVLKKVFDEISNEESTIEIFC